MIELKTLKDLKFCDGSLFVITDDGIQSIIKQEAIKHIKELQKPFPHLTSMEGTEVAGIRKRKQDAQIHWIKNFFNITEEDLK
jgi:hypothetical protein